MEAFKKFDEPRGAVTPDLLKAIYAKMEQEAPPTEELEAFIESVYAERESGAAALKAQPAARGVPVGDGPEGARARRHFRYVDNLLTNFDTNVASVAHQKDVVNMYDIFANSVKVYPDNDLYGTSPEPGKPFVFESYSQVNTHVSNIAAGLTALGIQRQQFVGVMLDTSPEWGIIEQALWRQAMVPVTLYSTYGKEAMSYIINHAELQIIFTSKKSVSLLSDILGECANLKRVIYVGEQSELEGVKLDNVEVVIYSDLEKNGSAKPVDAVPATADDNALVIYTSGTTGNPKGAVHKHSGMVAMVAGNVERVPFCSNDKHLAFLPMAHIMEQFIEGLVYAVGGGIGFFSGDIRVLMQDVGALRPTKFIAVPRLLNRLYVQLRGAFNALEGPKKAVFEAAMASKKMWLAKGCYKSFYDLFVFKRSAAALGGRCGLLATGSAPIDPGMLEFFRIVFSCPVLEGYGMTEVLVTNLTDVTDVVTRSHVGPPSPSVEVKLVDVPEMNYLTSSNPPQGEVCFRGPMNLSEYYKSPEKTKEAIDDDGWFHSGDIGEFYEDGCVRLIDRIKHIFKLSQGEYVAPEKLEQLFVHSKYVAQIFVNGSSLKSALVCVVVPDPAVVESAIKEFNVADEAALFASEDFAKAVLADIDQIGRAAGAKGFEIPRAVRFTNTTFDVLGLLTPTFKMKRNEARKVFNDLSEEMYKTID